MAVTKELQPKEGSKRQRRPSVRLGEIGEQPAAALTKQKQLNLKLNPPPNPNNKITLHAVEEGEEREWGELDIDNLALTDWKIKSKKPRTNWVSKINEGYYSHSESESPCPSKERSPSHSSQEHCRVPQNSRVGIGDDVVELEGPCDNGGGKSGRLWEKQDGVRVWLNGLGLGKYWPVFEIHEVDEEVLPLLTLEDLKEMGINAVGSRRKMFCAIEKLNKVQCFLEH